MKKRLLSIVLLLAMVLSLAACGEASYEVRFELNGGELVSGSLLQHVAAGAAAEAPEVKRDGYVFDGWSEDLSAVGGNMVAVALWTRAPEPSPEPRVFEVRFELNGGELVSGSLLQHITEGGAAEAPEVKREGYVFDGWSEDFDKVENNIIAAAMWRREYKVLFYSGGGSVVSGSGEQLVAEGDMPQPPELERRNYTFAGWDPKVVAVSGDAVYTAQWKAVELRSEEIFNEIAPAVVEILADDASGLYYSLGSGFFIDDQGTLVTNYHVIDGAVSGQINLPDGESCDIVAVLGYDTTLDLAVLKADVSGNPYLRLAEKGVVTGETIYALGSSEGLTNTFSAGNVSTASRMIDGIKYIQITAPISHGNSGGPLVNVFGEVVGINTMGYTEGQNLNFAVDIRELSKVDRDLSLSLADVYALEYPEGYPSSDDDSLYAYADYAEVEPNDVYQLADQVEIGSTIAGELTVEDMDWFYLTVNRACEVSFLAIPGYVEDMDYLMCGVARIDDEGEADVFDVLEPDSEEDMVFLSGTIYFDEPGTYYLVLLIDESYPYSDPVYYILVAE